MNNYPILAVCSGKGGVGKSSISFNLAKMLRAHNYNVGLVDADIYGPSLHLLLTNLGSLKPEYIDGKIQPVNVDGLQFMSAAFFAPGGAFIRAPKATGIVKSFFDNVAWDNIDILIVDFPPGTGDIPLTLFQEISFDAALVVTTPHTLAVEDAAKSGVQILQSGIPVLGVIENMSYLEVNGSKLFPFGQGGGDELADILKTSVISRVPLFDQKEEYLVKIEEILDKRVSVFQKLITKSKNNLNPCCR